MMQQTIGDRYCVDAEWRVYEKFF